MKILLTGATGFIGRRLCIHLVKQGHEILVISRSPRTSNELPFPCTIFTWNLTQASPPPDYFDGVETVIHLAGEAFYMGSWSEKQREKIIRSRVIPTKNLMQTCTKVDSIKLVIATTAPNIYGGGADEQFNEESPAGTDFLAKICQQWEEEILSASNKKLRTVVLRPGLILANGGGFLGKIIPLLKIRLGNPFGPGQHWLSWIHYKDFIDIIELCFKQAELTGPVNCSSPSPITVNDFCDMLCQAIGIPNPTFKSAGFIKWFYGEKSLFTDQGQRMSPSKITQRGFSFRHPFLDETLKSLLPLNGKDGAETILHHFWLPFKPENVFSFMANPENLEHLLAPSILNRFIPQDPPITNYRAGSRLSFQAKILGIHRLTEAEIALWEPDRKIVMDQITGFFPFFQMSFTLSQLGSGTLVQEQIDFILPSGFLFEWLRGQKIRAQLRYLLQYRANEVTTLFANLQAKNKSA